MKNLITFLSLFLISAPVSLRSQIETTVEHNCYMFNNIKDNGFADKTKIKKGEQVIFLDESDIDSFYKIVYKNDIGYIKNSDLTINNEIRDFLYYKEDSIRKHFISLETEKRKVNDSNYKLEIAKEIKQKEEIKKIEEARKKHENELLTERTLKKISYLKDNNYPVILNTSRISSINSAGRLDLFLNILNISSKPIKYITYTLYFKNAVDDIVYNEIGNRRDCVCKTTGPIKTGEYRDEHWNLLYYNATAKDVIITKINIQFMDNTSVLLDKDKCEYLMRLEKDKIFIQALAPLFNTDFIY